MIRKTCAVIGLLVLISDIAIAQPAGLPLTVGRLSYDDRSKENVQQIAVKNETERKINYLVVQCGFFQKGELFATGIRTVTNIFPQTTGFAEIRYAGLPADRAECRISEVHY